MADPRSLAFAQIIVEQGRNTPIGGVYTDLELLSADGFTSVVFTATDVRTSRITVLKFLKYWADDYRKACFKREASAGMALVGKDNVVQLVADHDSLTVELVHSATGLVIPIVCEYFGLEQARETLTAALFGRRRPRALYRRLELMRDVVKGVNRLHNAGYCHRDLKPDNVLIFRRGVAKVADLGTCRFISGIDPIVPNYFMPPGDQLYAAPEMFNGGSNIPELYLPGDWFSVGAMLFEAVTGQNLYLSIGLKGPREIIDALAVSRDVSEYMRLVGTISGRYPIPSTTDFSSEPWLAAMSDRTHGAVTRLLRDLCHFDFRKRLTDFDSVLRRLDIAIEYSKGDSVGWRKAIAGAP